MIHHGDCLEVMAGMDPESVDAIPTKKQEAAWKAEVAARLDERTCNVCRHCNGCRRSHAHCRQCRCERAVA